MNTPLPEMPQKPAETLMGVSESRPTPQTGLKSRADGMQTVCEAPLTSPKPGLSTHRAILTQSRHPVQPPATTTLP